MPASLTVRTVRTVGGGSFGQVCSLPDTIQFKAFDAALGRELHDVIQKTKEMANSIQRSSDLWDLEKYLTQRRKEIDRKYIYRHSELTQVFGRLLHERRVSEEELRGLREDKLASIRSTAEFLAKYAA